MVITPVFAIGRMSSDESFSKYKAEGHNLRSNPTAIQKLRG